MRVRTCREIQLVTDCAVTSTASISASSSMSNSGFNQFKPSNCAASNESLKLEDSEGHFQGLSYLSINWQNVYCACGSDSPDLSLELYFEI